MLSNKSNFHDLTLKQQLNDEARWARYQETGQAISQERVMQWLDALADGRRQPCPD